MWCPPVVRPGHHGQVSDLGRDLLLLDVFAKLTPGVLVDDLAYLAEVGFAVGLGVPVEVTPDLLLAEFGLSDGYRIPGVDGA